MKDRTTLNLPWLVAGLLGFLMLSGRAIDSIITFNEVMYHPAGEGEAEWVELYNQMSVDVDLTGWRLGGGIEFEFAEGTVLPSGGFLVVNSAADAAPEWLGPFERKLANSGEVIRLFNNSGRLMDELDYEDGDRWPMAPDGSGATLAKHKARSASGDPQSWVADGRVGGSPGRANFPDFGPLPVGSGDLVINELSPASVTTFWLELYNSGGSEINLNGLVLSISADPEREVVISGQQRLSPGDYRVLNSNLPLQDSDRIFLYESTRTRVLAARTASNSLRGNVESGEWSGRWLFPKSATPGAENLFEFEEDIVINEIMYHHRPEAEVRTENTPVEISKVFDFDQAWRFDQSGNDPGLEWAAIKHEDWSSGQGVFGFDTSGLSEPITTALRWPALNDPFVITYYFETEFHLDEANFSRLRNLAMTHLIDDGAVFFVNGVEISGSRHCLPAGLVTRDTLAICDDDALPVGGIEIPREFLKAGENRLSIEIHQGRLGSSDVVFGLSLDAVLYEDEGIISQPFREVPEEWIELYNRSDHQIDLSLWSLQRGVTYLFPEGTRLDPGAFLVISNNETELQAKFPEVSVLGNFKGRLNNSDELLELRDRNRNPADLVRYFDGGRWPENADGEGASLELRNPGSPNQYPEVWGASDESDQSDWLTFRYRGPGEKFPASSEPNQYQEFIFGLLDRGEFLIDDLSVVEDPDNTARELIQDGSFESTPVSVVPASWRLLGNHGLHGDSGVIDDPAGMGKVLKVVATGAMWHLHDHAETTLKDQGSFPRISAAKDYEISFRARWLSGCPLLNTRLYFNRLPRTHLLSQPSTSGTPGARNSIFREQFGPVFSKFTQSPISPAAGRAVEISAEIDDPERVASVTLHWPDGNRPMVRSTSGRWSGSIPGQSAGAIISFYLEATDENGQTTTYPTDGAASRALVRWAGSSDRPSGLIENFAILLTPSDAAVMQRDVNLMTNHYQRGTVISGDEVFYDVGVKLKGSQRGRPDSSRRGFKIKFHPDQLFRGVHGSIGFDRSGGWRFGRTYGQDEILIWHIFNRAGMIPTLQNDLVNLHAPGVSEGSAQLQLSRYSNDFLDDQFKDGADGSLHNYELIYFPTTTAGGIEGLKRPNPDSVLGVPLRDLGEDREAYRYHFQLRNNRTRDDYSGMIGLAELFSLSGIEFENQVSETIDVNQWLRAYAAVSLCAVSDSYFSGTNSHNARFYQRPEDGRMLLFPWDMDFSFVLGATSPLVANSQLRKLLAVPKYEREFYGHVVDLVDQSYNLSYMGDWIDHYDARLTRQSLGAIKPFIQSRSAHALSLAESAIPKIEFHITTSPFESDLITASIEGTAWVDLEEIRLAGTSKSFEIEWLDATRWRVGVVLSEGVNQVMLEAVNARGEVIGSDGVSITNKSPGVAAGAGNLLVSEIMYHPSALTMAEIDAGVLDSEEFEYLELYNPGTMPINLREVTLSGGIEFQFRDDLFLEPDSYLVLVRNKAAFNLRYQTKPSEIVIGGTYSGKLNNAGEDLKITAADGNLILEFSYQDRAPWPGGTDGEGYSLNLIAPDRPIFPNLRLPENWRMSPAPNGTPGIDDRVRYQEWKIRYSLTEDLADPDRDGFVNLAEYAHGTDPLVADRIETLFLSQIANENLVKFLAIPGADDVEFTVHSSSDLETWKQTDIPYHSTEIGPSGRRVIAFDFSAQPKSSGYFRVTIQLRLP